MKSIKKYIMILSFIGLFAGCSQSATSVFKKDAIYAQNLQYTKVGKVIYNDEVEALINITYLNSVNSLKWDNKKQNFIVGIYIQDGIEEGYTLKMNGNSFIEKEEIDKLNDLYENIAYKNSWAKYYIITFENTKDKKIILNYSHNKKGSTDISFDKE